MGNRNATVTAAKLAAPASLPKRVTVLGATGSIGASTLDLVARNPHAYKIVALTAQSNARKLAELAVTHGAEIAVIGDETRYGELCEHLSGTGIRAAAGRDALVEAASEPADCVMAAIVGAAGLEPTFAAVAQGKRLALANKECLVSAGDVFMEAVRKSGAELLPVDSEHSAGFQALGANAAVDIEKIILTASGGPFRSWTFEQIAAATPEQALKHPNWSMGAKITIDSASLMNKGLELIEAYHLFPVEVEQLDCIVHPQSIVHCLVTYRDGSVLAQLSCPDMRTPIALSLAWPARMEAPTERLNLVKIATLTFEAPDEARFPALAVAKDAMRRGGTAPAIMNAANEIAVEAFLNKKIGFLDIARTVRETLDRAEGNGLLTKARTLSDVLEVDREARALARASL